MTTAQVSTEANRIPAKKGPHLVALPASPASRPWPRTLWVFYAIQTAAALAIFVTQVPNLSGSLGLLILLLALNLVAQTMLFSVYGEGTMSVGFAVTTALIILFGAPGVVLATVPEAIIGKVVRRRKIDLIALSNATMNTVVYAAGALAYTTIASVNPDTFHWRLIPAVAACSAAAFCTNAILLCLARWLRLGQSPRTFWEQNRWLTPHYLSLGGIGLALAAAYMALGIVGIFVFITPALMMRLSMKQYVDKTAENVEKLKQQNTALQTANVEIMRVSDELRDSYDGTLEALVNALDARDQETKGHSIRVSHYMMDIASELGVQPGTEEWVNMQRGSLLHDVGKIGVSDGILLKPGKLTPAEWELMRLHPEIGYQMLRQVKFLQGPAEIILAHHERWDGAGYPRGLSHEEIPLGARIFAVVDTFDSMTSDRPYRKARTTLEAMNEIMRFRGSQFDPLVVEAFLDIYDTWVRQREEMFAQTERLAA